MWPFGLVLIVIPSQSFREVARALAAVLAPEQAVIPASKGLEVDSHSKRPSFASTMRP
jgi:glycerol-3-phosphate dehydrogenase